MDDATAITKDETVTEILKESKLSIDRLHEAKPYHDISIKSDEPENKAPTDTTSSSKKSASKLAASSNIETVFEKLNVVNEIDGSTIDSVEPGKGKEDVKAAVKIELEDKTKIAVPPLNLEISGRVADEGAMDSGREVGNSYSVRGSPSGKITRRHASNTTSVFPVGCMGCREENPLEVKPSPRRFLDANEASQNIPGHIDSTPRKKSSRQDIARNPLTGVGIEPTESRRQMIKRKDGNPVLGTGYDEANTTSTTKRVPPGGYSNGLW